MPTAAVVKAAEIPQMLNSMSVAPDLSEDESLIQVLGANDVQIDLDVKDEGMMLINTVAPDFEWHSGTAEVSAR